MNRPLLLAVLLIGFFFSVLGVNNGQSKRKNKTEYYAEEYALSELEHFISFFEKPTDINNAGQLLADIEWSEAAFAEGRFIVHRLPTQGNHMLIAERNWVNQKLTVLFYFELDELNQLLDQAAGSINELQLKDGKGKNINLSTVKVGHGVGMDWIIHSPVGSEKKSTIGIFCIALKAIKERFSRPRYNVKVLINTQRNASITSFLDKYETELAADMVISFEGTRHKSSEPILNYAADQESSEKLSWLKEGMLDTFDGALTIEHQSSFVGAVTEISQRFQIPAVNIPLVNTNIGNNESTPLQKAYYIEGIRTVMELLQFRF